MKGKVVVLADYGAFVEIAPGVEGLLHVSEMSWSQHLRSPHDFLKVGEEIECVVLTLDREERKMSLGLKQLKPDPWVNVITKYPAGTKLTATVKNFTNFWRLRGTRRRHRRTCAHLRPLLEQEDQAPVGVHQSG